MCRYSVRSNTMRILFSGVAAVPQVAAVSTISADTHVFRRASCLSIQACTFSERGWFSMTLQACHGVSVWGWRAASVHARGERTHAFRAVLSVRPLTRSSCIQVLVLAFMRFTGTCE